MTARDGLEFYRHPAAMTALGGVLPDALLDDVPELVRTVQGVVLHEFWADRYGAELSDERRGESHIRRANGLLEQILRLEPGPLTAPRPPHKRLVGTCRHFSVLLVALLRQRGVPARARCGFAGYFTPGRFEDHWVAEYWDDDKGRWVLVDAQLDELQREVLGLEFSPLDVPPERFLTADEAWARCRSNRADPAAFGIHDMHGSWFVAANLVRDLAALNKTEMLPWDVWGATPSPDAPLTEGLLTLFDRLAALTSTADISLRELQALYEDDRLRVPTVVFNAARGCREAV